MLSKLLNVSVRSVNFTLRRLRLNDSMLSRIRHIDPFLDQNAFPFVYGLSDKGAKQWGGRTFDEHSNQTDHDLEIAKFIIHLKQFEAKTTHQNLHRSLWPDLLINLRTKNGWFNLFLEVEKSKKGFDYLTEKFQRYAALYNTDECEKEWGFKKFRVLIVQRNAERMRNLLNEMHSIPALNNRMFWLTTETLYPADQYKTPKDFDSTTYSLKEL